MGSDIYSIQEGPVVTCTLLMIHEMLETQVPNWKHVLKSRIKYLVPLGINQVAPSHATFSLWITLRLGKWRRQFMRLRHSNYLLNLKNPPFKAFRFSHLSL